MSKTTKVIAALGVVAGLGVAALPAFTFAEGEPSVSADVDLYVKVKPAIAMTIEGNNDDTSDSGHIDQDGEWSTDTDDHGKASRFAPAGTNVKVDTFDGTDGAFKFTDIEHGTNGKTSSSKVELSQNDYGTMASTVNVYTNNTTGYKLSVKAAGAAKMVNDRPSTGDKDEIAAGAFSGTDLDNGTPKGGLGKWAFKTDLADKSAETGVTVDTNDWAQMPESTGTAAILRNVSTKTSDTGNRQTVVTYGVSTSPDQASGIYKTTLTYTATCNE